MIHIDFLNKTKKRTKDAKYHLPVGLCPEDCHRTTEPAGKWDPEFSLLLWFSSWPSTRRSPGHTPLRRLLQTHTQTIKTATCKFC